MGCVVDEQAFRALYRSYYADVTRYVCRRLDPSGPVDAADVTATVFLTAWRRRHEIPVERPLAWLYGVARGTLANEVRARRRAADLHRRVAEASTWQGVGDHAETVTMALAVGAAFDTLREGDQEVLRLVAWESLTVADAARVLGCSTAACAVRLHRARRRLHGLLDATAQEAASVQRQGSTPGRVREGKSR